MIFRPAISGQILVLTAIVNGFLLVLAGFFFFLNYQLRNRGPAHYVFLFSGCFMVLLVLIALNFRIRSYEVASGNLVVRVGLTTKTFPLRGLQEARVEQHPFAGCRRDLGVGGLWSNYGVFTSPKWGRFHAYASRTSSGVLLVWPDRRVLVTPQDASAFIESVRQNQ